MKVQESFVAGPATVSRAGRFVEIKSKWPPGEHEKFKRRAREERPKLKQGIDAAIGRLMEIVQKHDPIPLIRTLQMKNGVFDAESYVESTFEGSEAYVEYLQSLAMAVPVMGAAPPKDSVFDDADRLIRQLFDDVELFFGLEFTDEKLSEWEYRVRFTLILRFLKLRGASMEAHHRDLIRGLFSDHDEFLKERVGWTTDQIMMAIDEIERQYIGAINDQVDAVRRAKQVHERFRLFVDSRPDLGSMPEIMREFDPTIDPAEREQMKKMFTIEPAHIHPNERLPLALLDRLVATPGENVAFLSKKARGWPLSDSVIYTKPLIRRDEKYYCCNPVLPFRKLDRIIESWIAGDQNYYRHTFTKKRGVFVETEALRHLASLLPKASISRNLYYSMREGDKEKRFETDAVIVWDRALFIVEGKAAGLDVPSRRGALEGLKEDISGIVVEAFEQGFRTQKFIESADFVTFEDDGGQPILTVKRADFDDVFIVNVTLESLGFLSAGVHVLKEMGLLDGDWWAWSVFLNDLRVIAEIFETGSDFVAFLRARLRAPDAPQFQVADELDFLTAYLLDGVNLIDVDLSNVDMLNLHGYTADLDRYYSYLAGSVATGPKPSSKTPATLQAIVEAIEREGRTDFLRATLTLLQLDRSTMKWLAKDMDYSLADTALTANRHQSQLSSPEAKTLLTVYSARSWSTTEVGDKLKEVKLRKYDARANRSVSIFLAPGEAGPEVVEYVVDDAMWLPVENIDVEVERRKRSFIGQFTREHGTPKPNVKCPCGSGRKFKQCCDRLG